MSSMDSCSRCLQVATANCRLNRPAALPRLSAAPREMDGDLAALREALCVSARDGRRSCGSARGSLRLRARWTTILRLCARLSAAPREMDDDPTALREAICLCERQPFLVSLREIRS